MKRPSTRGSAPGRARDAYQRPRSFEHGHKKLAGRQRGTPNAFSADYKKAILEAAYRIGFDGNGRDGIVGYFKWLALYHIPAFAFLLGHILGLEALESMMTPSQLPTLEQLNERTRDLIEWENANPRPEECAYAQSEASLSAEWTGQKFPVSELMNIAVTAPNEFAKLMAGGFLRAAGKRRRLAAPRW